MVKKRTLQKPGEIRLEECPFCGTELDKVAPHLELCRAFHEVWGHSALEDEDDATA